MEKIKFRDKSLDWYTLKPPVFIVGQCPGRQRKHEQTHVVWEGNRSSDLLEEAVEGLGDLYFTNICNYQDPTLEEVHEGMLDLERKIVKLNPRKIICLGEYAYSRVIQLPGMEDVVKLPHPSFIMRFHKNKQEWIQQLRKAITT